MDKMTRVQKLLKQGCVIALMAVLAGCAHAPMTDGPPGYDVDVSKIPDAVPKDEPLSKNGNMPYYHVFGKTYYVMSSSKGYEERGVASWYGRKFHAHHTSNGERYNMLGMTAAHKTLPLPTYVQVTNLKNGKKVIVKVNDRGPFESNRLIDLSYVAAKKLGMLGHGTAYVDVKAIDAKTAFSMPELFARHSTPSAPPVMQQNSYQRSYASSRRVSRHVVNRSPAVANNQGTVYLQVGAFKNRSNAEVMRHRLLGMSSSTVKIFESESLYHVKVGPFRDSASAKRFNLYLKTHGLSKNRIKVTYG